MVKLEKNTPKGIASYPWLNTPDIKFGTPGHYKCQLVLDPASDPEVDVFVADYNKFVEKAKADCVEQINEAIEAIPDNPKNKAKRKELLSLVDNIEEEFKNPLSEQYDDEGELTGKLVLDCRSNAEWINPKDNMRVDLKPRAFDATGNLISEPPMVKGGSTLRLSINLSNYFMPSNKICGIAKPKIKAYQIIKKSSGGGGGGGFGAEEGGYVQEQKVAPSFDDVDTDSAEY